MRRTLVAATAGVVAASAALAGCTSGGTTKPSPAETITSTVTGTRPPAGADFTPEPASTVAPRPKSGAAPKGERKGRCPYIRSGLNEDPTKQPNFADTEGNRVGLTTILTGRTPVGCRFYFAYDRHAVGDILPTTFTSAQYARSAMIKTSEESGTNARAYPDFVPGVDGINFRTKFYGPDKGKDWAFAFAKGTVMVVIRTDQDDSPLNALYVARAIVGKF